ncbi:hypothetical protein ASC90_27525 [Rhizobium sp. Root1220]|nr:hypothetical protein ASC90_27525 [Rhizobium sp. Root1220]
MKFYVAVMLRRGAGKLNLKHEYNFVAIFAFVVVKVLKKQRATHDVNINAKLFTELTSDSNFGSLPELYGPTQRTNSGDSTIIIKHLSSQKTPVAPMHADSLHSDLLSWSPDSHDMNR